MIFNFIRIFITTNIFFFGICNVGFSQKVKKYSSVTKLSDDLREISGICVGKNDTFWVHNDGGNSPVLYAILPDGKIVFEKKGNWKNIDWEDITKDDDGNIYIGDFGNNSNKRDDLVVYKWDRKRDAISSIRFVLPDQKAFPPNINKRNFDIEAFFWHNDSLFLFTKNVFRYGNYFTKMYVLPAQAGNFVAVLKDSIYLKSRVVTSAAISPNKTKIVLLTYNVRYLGRIPFPSASVYIFKDFDDSNFLKGTIQKIRIPPCGIAKQYEGIDFEDEKTLIIATEKTPINKAKLERLFLK